MFDHIRLSDLDLHVKIVAWLSIVLNSIFVLIGAFCLILLVGIGAVSADGTAFGVLLFVGTLAGVFFAVLGLPGIVAGIALLSRAGWGRILGIVIAAISLLNFPVGTALGAYMLWVLLQKSAEVYFSPPAIRADVPAGEVEVSGD